VTYRAGPERLVASVRVAGAGGEPKELSIEAGISDGLLVEVKDGLEVGDRVLVP